MGFTVLPLFCIKECKDVLAGHEALLHIPDFQVVQWEHVFLFFFLLFRGEREREDFNKTSRQRQTYLLNWLPLDNAWLHYLDTIKHYFLHQLPRNTSYLRWESPGILNTWVESLGWGRGTCGKDSKMERTHAPLSLPPHVGPLDVLKC